MISHLTNIIQKEWREIFRDRRSMLTLLGIAFGMPLYAYFLIAMIASRADREPEITAAVVGAEMAPNLITFLEEQNITFKNYETLEGAKDNLQSKEIIIVLEPDFRENYLNSLPATVSLYVNRKDNAADGNGDQVDRLIKAYNRTVEQARLVARGVSPARTVAIDIEEYDLTPSGGRSNQLAGMLQTLLLLGAISGTISATADVIAGERERHTLQPLLTQPVSPGTLIIGKWLTLAMLGVLFSLIAFYMGGLFISKSPLEKLGVTFYLDVKTISLAAFSMSMLAFFMTSLQTFLATIAKSYREAMTYMPMVMLVPMAISFVPAFMDVSYDGALSYVPGFNQIFVLKELLLEGKVPIEQYFGGMLTTLGASVVVIFLAMTRFGSEQMLD